MAAFDFEKNYVLEDGRARLAPLQASDISRLAHFADECDIWKYSSIRVENRETFESYIAHALQNREKKTEYPFVVFDKKTNRYAGSTRFYDIQLQNRTLQLGYTWYGTEFHGTGLNKHCKFLLLSFAFDQMGMDRVEFRADNNNARSIAAMKSIGCQVDGILRSNMLKPDGTRRDSIVLSILKSEWQNGLRDRLRTKPDHPKDQAYGT
jgi:RimJ/RimL family protein N-acetyltransferase